MAPCPGSVVLHAAHNNASSEIYLLLKTNQNLEIYIDDTSRLTADCLLFLVPSEPRREKTGLRGFRPGPTQTGLYKLRKELEA